MIDITDISDFITKTLIESTEYEQLSISLVGEKLNFEDSTPIDQDYAPISPYLVVTTDEDEVNEEIIDGYNDRFKLIVSIGIKQTVDDKNGYTSVDENGVLKYPDKNKVHKLMVKAYSVLKSNSWSCGIAGEDIKLIGRKSAVAEIGEASVAVEGYMILEFAKQRTLEEGW